MTKKEVMAKLEAAGIEFDANTTVANLKELLPDEEVKELIQVPVEGVANGVTTINDHEQRIANLEATVKSLL